MVLLKLVNVLFVCTHNVFRSFSAERILKNYILVNGFANSLDSDKIPKINVSSAGIYAYPQSPYSYTINKLNSLGIDASNHKQSKVSQKLVDDSDVIICMTKHHKDFIEHNFNKKCFLFNELAHGKSTDVSDDDEISFDTSLKKFVEDTVQYIHDGMPNLYDSLVLMFK